MPLFSFFKKPVCALCANPDAKNVLVTPQIGAYAKRVNLCREHFLAEYKKSFMAFPEKMVVAYPIIDAWNSCYGFYPISDMATYGYQQDEIDAAKNLLKLIPSDKECAFFDIDASKAAVVHDGWQSPAEFKESDAKFVSKEYAVNKILEAFTMKSGDFLDGYTVPFGGEGINVASML